MKTTVIKCLVAVSLLFASVFNSFADGSADFNYDRAAIESEFTELSKLEQFVESKDFISLSEINEQEFLPASLSGLSLSPIHMIEDPMGIPGFWWGCIFGPIGIALAYVLSDKDQYQARQALTGCIVNGVVSVGIVVVYYLWILTYFSVY
jgi:hypothetical protein